MRRLFDFHGAGGFIDDRPIAEGLAQRLGCAVEMPHIPDEDMSFEAWATIVRRYLDAMKSGDSVVAHSFGASILLRVLAEKRRAVPSKAVLLAMPGCPRRRCTSTDRVGISWLAYSTRSQRN
ncbi:alpha/beta hydrolase [Rhodococcus sp. PAMC28707]|uniref:alpha/beta fold hydrolase n=1 Tax=unclassified Rhodococcus (in: high G+C Gram-positive bacteria) TaxID=192944 RepID=UPI0026DA6B6B